jgi:nucleotide-binding universal stress UspA family protein
VGTGSAATHDQGQEDDVRSEGLIVVGVDGSRSARRALEFALEEAARWSARVRVVTAFHMPDYWPVTCGMGASVIAPPSVEEMADDAERMAQQAVADATVTVGPEARAVPVEVRVVSGSPAGTLVDQAAEADLLVVGHRGRGGIASACLGSVGLHCVLHATCPVVVVRDAPVPAEQAATAGAARA